MEEGEDGGRDEWLLLALREIECSIPEGVTSVTALSAVMLVEVVARCVNLISEGATQFAMQLPSGAASKHRACTKMAEEVKKAGFPGECSFNQLLYPTDASTRALVTFLVEKLPRAEETGPSELTSGALVSHRIASALDVWVERKWTLPFCPGREGWQVHEFALAKPPEKLRPLDATTFPTAVERIAHKIIQVSAYEAHLESTGRDGDAADGGPTTSSDGARRAHSRASAAMAPNGSALRAVFSSASQGLSTERGGARGATFGVGAGLDGSMSLGEILDAISNQGLDLDARNSAKRSRFAHAMEFGQEQGALPLPGGAAGALAGGGFGLASRRWSVSSLSGSGAASGAGAAGDKADAENAAMEQQKTREQQAQAALVAQREAAEVSLAELHDSLRECVVTVETSGREHGMLDSRIRQLEASLSAALVESDALEKKYTIKRKALEMLPNAAESIKQLQSICAQSAQRLMQVGQEWETHRAPLLNALREQKGAKAARVMKAKGMMDEIRSWRAEMQQMALDVREKEERVGILNDELSKLPKNLNRTLYTYRIMDIIGSIAKQKKEIAKIISDIRDVQKEINLVSETLTRTEALADEKIFQEANKPEGRRDPAMVQSYRHLSDIRQCFEDLIKLVSHIGLSERDARELESKSQQLLLRTSSNNREQIMADLQQVKQENMALIQQLKQAK